MPFAVTLSQLESHLWEAANILRGPSCLERGGVIVCRTHKLRPRPGKILFINAVNEVTRKRAQSFLTAEHLQRVVRAYQEFKDEPSSTLVVPIEEIWAKEGSLKITLYIGVEMQDQTDAAAESVTTALPDALKVCLDSSQRARTALELLTPKSERRIS